MRKNEPPKKAYVKINFYKMYSFDLKLNEYIIAQIIQNLSENTGEYYGTRDYLANCTGLNVRTIKNIIKRLIQKGFIHRDSSNHHLTVSEEFKRFNNCDYMSDEEFYSG